MKQIRILTTALKTRDAVAETAFHTLTHDMGYRNILTGLKREDYWKIELESGLDGRDPGSIMTELAEKTRVFVNINKHVYTLHNENTLHTTGQDSNPEKTFTVHVLIVNTDDRIAKNALATLHALYTAGRYVRSLETGVVWIMTIRTESNRQAQDIAREIAVTESRERGLLANPHYQNVLLL
jgi:hypothetical protein